jgi:hypothetical protein
MQTTQQQPFIYYDKVNNTGFYINNNFGDDTPNYEIKTESNLKITANNIHIKENGSIYTQDWTDLTPLTTYYSFSPFQYKVIGDQTCLYGEITCVNPDDCTDVSVTTTPIAKLPYYFSPNTPYQGFLSFNNIAKYEEPPTPYQNFEFGLLIYNSGNIYPTFLGYNQSAKVYFCFRNKL